MVRPRRSGCGVEKSAIAYSGNKKNSPNAAHSTARKTLPPQRGAPHRSHLAVRLTNAL